MSNLFENENVTLINISVDDEEYFCKPETSIIEVCKYSGITIPRFCYHELLSVSGNCRMCLVEIEGVDKPVAACVSEVSDGMSILLNSPFPKKARENVIELILLHHPLDCPICDQAGECDLQDQARAFGAKLSRFYFNKRSTEDKACGPLIKTIMTRCITCTRCVRFCDEVAGIGYFGTLNRGENTEIGPYIEKIFNSEISGNVVELCPVGALNSKPISNEIRPWELKMLETIDLTDSLGSNIYVEHKETNIVRISPKVNAEINRSLISDKARFIFDANKNNRLNDIFKTNKDGFLKKSNWEIFFKEFDKKFNSSDDKYEIIIDSDTDSDTIVLLKSIANKYPNKVKLSTFENTYKKNIYINRNFNSIENIENKSDSIFFIATDLKIENPVLNTKVKTKYNNSLTNIFTSGLTAFEYNVENEKLNANISYILNYFEGKNLHVSNIISKSNEPLFIYGENISDQVEDFSFFINKKLEFIEKANITFVPLKSNLEALRTFNISQISKSDLNNKNIITANISSKTVTAKNLKNKNIVTSFATHPSLHTNKANVIVPVASSLESESIYLNLEHRAQKTNAVYFLHNGIYQLKDTIAALFFENELLNDQNKEFMYIEEILFKSELFSELRNTSEYLFDSSKIHMYKHKNQTKVFTYPIFQRLKNFYQNSIMSLNSKILESCTVEKKQRSSNFTS